MTCSLCPFDRLLRYKMNMKRIFSLIPILVPLLLVGCNRSEPQTQAIGADTLLTRPDTEVVKARVLLYNKGAVTTEIIADRILKYEAKDSMLAYVLNVTSFDTLGHKTSSLTSDSGIVRENSGVMNAYGHVVAFSDDSTKLETDHLRWDSKEDKIITDAFVRITRPNGDVITGIGLETDQKMSRLKILQRVKGTVQDIERLNEEGNSSGSVDSSAILEDSPE